MAHGAKGRCWEVRKVKTKNSRLKADRSSKLKAKGSKESLRLFEVRGWRQKWDNFLFLFINESTS
jgi:hypothetical protein